MEFLNEAINFMKIAVTAIGAGITIMGIINFAEGQSDDNPANKSRGVKMLVGGVIIMAVGTTLVPKLSSFFTF